MNRKRIYREFTVRLKEEGEFGEEYDAPGFIDVTCVEAFYRDLSGHTILETECDRWQVAETMAEVLEKVNVD